MRISDRLTYFNPWSEKFHFFEGLTLFQRIRTAITAIFASLALVFASDSTFRRKVEHYHYQRASILNDRHFARESLADLPRTHCLSGLTHSSAAHLVQGIALARNAFPNLLTSASTDGIYISRLIQIILSGEEAKGAHLPKSVFCFMVRELQGRSFPVKKDYYRYSYLDDCVRNATARRVDENEDSWLERNIIECTGQFLRDFSRQPSIQLFNQRILKKNLSNFFERLKTIYLGHIRANPGEVREIVNVNKKSPFFRKFLEYFSSESSSTLQRCTQFFSSKYPPVTEGVLRGFFEKIEGEGVSELQTAILTHTKMLPDEIQEIAQATQCDASDVESLLRFKMLEVVMLSHQANYAKTYDNLHRFFQERRASLIPVSPEEKEEYFGKNQLRMLFIFPIMVDPNEGIPEELGIPKNTPDRAIVAAIKTEDIISRHLSEKSTQEITLIKEIAFTWQTTAKIIKIFQDLLKH